MQVDTQSQSIASIDADAVIIGRFAEEPLGGFAAAADEAMSGTLSRLIETDELSAKTGDVTTLLAPSGLKAGRLVVELHPWWGTAELATAFVGKKDR